MKRFRLPILLIATAALAAVEKPADSANIRADQYAQLQAYIQAELDAAPQVRAAYWKHQDFSSPKAYEKSIERYRRDWIEMVGMPPAYHGALEEKRVKVLETPQYTLYRVWFTAIPGVQTYGLLTLPKNVNGRAPALICQHGHTGMPEGLVGLVDAPVYRNFPLHFAERGIVTFSPYLVSRYSEENEPTEGPHAWGRDILFKRAVMVGRTLLGIEARKFTRTVDYLRSLPEVEADRIGMYGLSKGGQYTLNITALEPRLKFGVVSGWFNDRDKKNATLNEDKPGADFVSRVHRSEYYMRNMANQFSDAELAWLIAPRPLMIEAGDEDPSVRIVDARREFQRVKAVYSKLGIAERAVFAEFHGPHRIDGVESYPFVEKWLRK